MQVIRMSQTIYVTVLVHEVPCDTHPDVVYLQDYDTQEIITSSDDEQFTQKLKRIYDCLIATGIFSPIDYDSCGYVNGTFTVHDPIAACREIGEDAYNIHVIEMRRISDPDLSHVYVNRDTAIAHCENLSRHGHPAYAQAVTVL